MVRLVRWLVVGCGHDEVGKGYAALKQASAQVVTQIDPICILQALVDDHQLLTLDDFVFIVDFLVTNTSDKDIMMIDCMRKMENNVILCKNMLRDFQMEGTKVVQEGVGAKMGARTLLLLA